MEVKEIPKEFRRVHSSGATCCVSSGAPNSAKVGAYYCWPGFDGCVYYVYAPGSSLKGLTPTFEMYVNGKLHQTVTPPGTALEGKHLYEALFYGLSYGDTYTVKTIYDSLDGPITMEDRVYRGAKGGPPVLSETSTSVTASMSSPYTQDYSMALGVINFNRDYGSLNKYSREARTRLVESCLQYTEQDAIFGKVGNEASVSFDCYNPDTDEWTRPSVFKREAQIYKFYLSRYNPIKVGIKSSASTANYSYFSNYVDEWIDDINELLGYSYFVRDDGIKDTDTGIGITLGSHKQLYGYNPDETNKVSHIYYGSWEITRWNNVSGATLHCEVKLCNELRVAMEKETDFRNITYEELTECLGCGNDTYRVYDSMFSETWYIGKTNNLISGGKPTCDGEVVQMLYKEMEMGQTLTELVHKLTPSQACVIQLPYGKIGNVRNESYTISPYAMNRKVTWHTDPIAGTSDVYWWWDDSNNAFSNIGPDALSVTPAYSTPPKMPTVYDRGSYNLEIDVGDTNTYDVKAVDSGGAEYIVSGKKGRYIDITGLSPTTSYQIYSRLSGTEAWFGGYSGTTAPAPPGITVTQSGTSLNVTLAAPSEGVYSYLYVGVGYYSGGEYLYKYADPAVAGKTYTYTADSGTSYTVDAMSVYEVNGTELYSDYASEKGTMGKEKVTYPWATRIDGGLVINWNTVSGATNYRVKLVRGWDNYTYTNTTTSPPYKLTGLSYGVTHRLSVDTYNGGWLGYCAEAQITTAPAQPVITSVTQNSGVITVSWALAAESNVSNVYINLYTASGELLQEKVFSNTTGTQSFSGTFSFSAVEDGYYQIRAASSLVISGTEIFSVDDDGAQYTLYRDVYISARPGYFYWGSYTSEMCEGGTISGVPLEAWNALVYNLEEMIAHTGKNDSLPSSSALYGNAAGKTYSQACAYAYIAASDKTVYAQKFNIVNYIISHIGASTGVGDKYSRNKNYKVKASDFIALQNTINDID